METKSRHPSPNTTLPAKRSFPLSSLANTYFNTNSLCAKFNTALRPSPYSSPPAMRSRPLWIQQLLLPKGSAVAPLRQPQHSAQPSQVGVVLGLQLDPQPRRASLPVSVSQALHLWLLLPCFLHGSLQGYQKQTPIGAQQTASQLS